MVRKANKTKANVRGLKKMLDELRQMSADMGNDTESGNAATAEELKQFDTFQKKKRELNLLLEDTRGDVARLIEMKNNPSAVSSRDRIELNRDNDNKIKTAVGLLRGLQELVAEDQRKFDKKRRGALTEEELSIRNSAVVGLANDIHGLVEKNSRAKRVPGAGGRSATIGGQSNGDGEPLTVREKRNQKKRENRRRRRNDVDVQDSDFQEVSEQDQIFMDKKDAAYAEQDDILGEISKGLTEIIGISTDMNKTLKYQARLLDEVDTKMDDVQVKLESANDKMTELFEASGGASTWCPRIICLVLLLAVAGYLFTSI